MEVLLLTVFFITVLVLFIAGKDDFGRTENKLIIKESREVKKEVSIKPTVEVKKEAELKTVSIRRLWSEETFVVKLDELISDLKKESLSPIN